MMNDQKLLDLAAKAANIQFVCWSDGMEPYSSGPGFILEGNSIWNPLVDDGDALRLAVKLKIPLQFPDWKDIARTWGPEDENTPFDEAVFDNDDDLGAATRRSIVRAAAEIGKAMP